MSSLKADPISALPRSSFLQNEQREEQKKEQNSSERAFGPAFLLSFGLLAARIEDEDREKRSKNNSEMSKNNSKLSRFLSFASIEVDGESCMTPRDFLDSVIQDHPRFQTILRTTYFCLEKRSIQHSIQLIYNS